MIEIPFDVPSKEDIIDASARIGKYIYQTPLFANRFINEQLNCKLFFKCENFQTAGSFKSRGVYNNLLLLTPEERRQGVCTHSSGNHAAALAASARLFGIEAYIVMPKNAMPAKVKAVKESGAHIIFCESTLESRENTLKQIQIQTGSIEIHPYNNLRTIAGQATACKELIEQSPQPLDIVMAPVGGGGLLSGTALSARYFGENIKVIAGEPENADDAARSFYFGKLMPVERSDTIADGLRTSLGTLTFPIISNYVHEIFTVSEESILNAMQLIVEKIKILIEPSSATPLAAIMENISAFSGKKIGIILSGGNIDCHALATLFSKK